MPEVLQTALGFPGAVWVLGITFVAGVVYGFAGFGAALVFMPVATAFISPALAVGAFSISAVISLVTVVPRAARECQPRPVLQLICAALIGMPLGLYALGHWDVTLLRWLVLLVATVTLVSLVAGWRRAAGEGVVARTGVGGAAGLIGGATGLVGPIVVLFQLSSSHGAARARANLVIFLTTTSLLTLPLMWLQNLLTAHAFWLGTVMIVPYGIGSVLGQALFNPLNERLYRNVAYVIIASAILVGLPVWGTLY